MPHKASSLWKIIGVAGALAIVVAWPVISRAQLPGIPPIPIPLPGDPTQTFTGQASAVTAVVLGNVSTFADTGTLSSASDPLSASVDTWSVPGASAETLQAVTMGWSDQVVSEASLGNLAMTVGGAGISADFIMSRAEAVSGAGGSGLSNIEGLTIGGVPISPTGLPNQAVSLPGLSVILNEQIQSANGIVVNALRITTLDGLTNVVIGSARAGI